MRNSKKYSDERIHDTNKKRKTELVNITEEFNDTMQIQDSLQQLFIDMILMESYT